MTDLTKSLLNALRASVLDLEYIAERAGRGARHHRNRLEMLELEYEDESRPSVHGVWGSND